MQKYYTTGNITIGCMFSCECVGGHVFCQGSQHIDGVGVWSVGINVLYRSCGQRDP